jgi:hypothetical protein
MAAKYMERKGFDPFSPAEYRVKKNLSKATNQYTGVGEKRLLCCCYETRDGGSRGFAAHN